MSTQQIKRRGKNLANAATTTIRQIRKHGNGSKSKQHEQVEKALRESEEKYRNLFENAIDMIVLVDTETGIILDVNTAGCNLLGLPKKKIIGRHQSELHPPELADKYKRIFQEHVQRGGVINDYVVVRRADGAQIPMDVSASVVKLADKAIIQGIFRDVTERARIEKALQESGEKFSKAFQSLPEQVAIVRKKDQIFIDVNESFCRNNGYTRKEIIGRTAEELNLPIKSSEWNQVRKMVKERGRAENVELEYRDKSGEKRTLLYSADIITIGGEPCLLTIGNDITERKKMERAIKESEEKFSKAFQASPDAIGIVTEKDGKFIDVNESYIRMTGYSREELIDTTTDTHNWVRPEDHTKMQKMMREKGKIYNEEFDYRTKSGKIRTRLFSIEPITINGELCRIGVSTDITELKRAEEALQKEKAFLSSILTSIQDGVTVLDNELNIIGANKTAEKWFEHGMPLIGKKCYKACHNRSKPCEACPTLQTLETGKAADRVVPRHGPDGMITGWSELHTFPIFDTQTGEISGVIEYGRDVTARKQAEEALRESEEKFSKAFHALPEQVTIVRMKDNVFVDVNESFCRYNGYTREEVIGHKREELNLLIGPSQRDLFTKIVKEQGRAENIELECQDKAGETRTLLFAADIVNIGGEPCQLTIANDITERKHIEQALKESEEKFSKAFRASPDAVSLITIKGERYIDINDSYTKMTGYSREELIGNNAFSINLWVNDENHNKMRQMMREQGRIYNEEFDYRTKSGEIRTRLFSLEPITINGEPCTIGVSTDITERKHIEQALKESEEKFSKAFQSLPEEVTIARIKDDVFIDVNENFCRNNGYTREEVIGRKGEELNLLIGPSEWDKVRKMVKEQGLAKNMEIEFRDKSGEINTLLFSADITNIGGEPCLLTIAGNITERKHIEQALRESEEKFSKAFHASPEAISIVSAEDKIIDVNDSYVRMFGYSREELIGNTTASMHIGVNPEDPNEVPRIIREQGRIYSQEHDYRTKSGEIRTRLLSLEPIAIKGEPCRIGVSTDITERKQAEKKLKEAMADLEQSSALLKATNKELESFSYSVSHDLRSPLRSIAGFSQALLEDYSAKLDEKGQDYLNRLSNASQKMGELIDGLLKLSRLTRSVMHHEKVDLTSLANEIASRLQETNPERNVKFIIGSDLKINGDPDMLRVLLENLLGNAFKFTRNTKQALIEFGSITEGEEKTFFIKDNGAGFDMAFVDKLFGAFQRLHDAAEFPGTGIGLATVQRIINRHGGSIRAEGELDKGATFYFTLS